MDRFTKTLHGYNPEEVNKFLDDIIAQVERIIKSSKLKDKEIANLREQINSLSKVKPDEAIVAKAKKYDELEGKLLEAIDMAKNTGEQYKLAAKQERNLILQDAKHNADLIMKDAIMKSKQIEYQVELLRKNIISFKRKLRVNLEEQIKFVDQIEIIDIENK
ncbi:MAG: DivIVA domain-containing protein [Bacilli bacterium]|nr:DivIVA domain-containing protein [Bacilli bacterium]